MALSLGRAFIVLLSFQLVLTSGIQNTEPTKDHDVNCEEKPEDLECTTDPNLKPDGIKLNSISKGQNLAWLVTPILLLLGAAYGIYKCVKDGVCSAIRHRILHGRRHRESRASDYHPLHQVSFCTSTQIPCTQLGINPANLTPQSHMLLVHNQFSIQIQGDGRGVENPITEGALLPAGTTLPPSYDEAMSAMPDGKGGTIVLLKNGNIIALPQGSVHPPPYPGHQSARSGSARPAASAAAGLQMESIEEVEEMEDEEEDNDDNDADEETMFLPRDFGREGGNVGGRRRHHSQWSHKRRSESRRRHHSCPS